MINFLNDFEQERPACQPWSLVPILCVLVGLLTLIAIAFLAKYINKTKNKKLLNGIILIYGLLFLGLEIYHEINRYFFFGYYDFSSIPFQFCSIPIYLCLILPFYQKRKDQNADILLPRHLLHDCRHLPVIVRTRTAMQMEQYLRCDPFLPLARFDSSGLHPICRPRRNRKKHQKRL